MHCVIQTSQFVAAAKEAGLNDEDVHNIVALLSKNPERGDVIKGTGGARKWRIPAKGKGKRSGARVVSFYSGEDIPVFLLDVFVKGDRIDLSQSERNELKSILGEMADDYRQDQMRRITSFTEIA